MKVELKHLKRVKSALSIFGLTVMGLGILLAYFNISGIFQSSPRKDFLNWVIKSERGLKIDAPAAKAFMKDFPPPDPKRCSEITHITKWTQVLENGLPFQAQINYMYSDNSRTPYVATLDDVRAWASSTTYPQIAWLLSLIGFLVVLVSKVFSYFITRTEQIK